MNPNALTIKLILLAIGTVALLRLSRDSLANPHSHGFFRLFAFEAVLVLILLNAEAWFRDPLGVRQIISWLLLLTSIPLAVGGFRALRSAGRPEGPVENTTSLVASGFYRLIRHPLYSSLLWLGWGACLKDPSLLAIGLALANTAFLTATAWVEEQEMVLKFGAEYLAYMRRTRRFIPWLF